jgi:hypothetical protein
LPHSIQRAGFNYTHIYRKPGSNIKKEIAVHHANTKKRKLGKVHFVTRSRLQDKKYFLIIKESSL